MITSPKNCLLLGKAEKNNKADTTESLYAKMEISS